MRPQVPQWLLPGTPALGWITGTVRTVGEPDPIALRSEQFRRWYRSARGQWYYEQRKADPDERADARKRKMKWWLSKKGIAWSKRNREKRNAYYRLRYANNREARRAYLNQKQREYRAREKANGRTV